MADQAANFRNTWSKSIAKNKKHTSPNEEHQLCADIRTGRSSYFIASHGLPRTAEWIEDEAIIELDAEISAMEPSRPEHVGQRIECSLVCARSFGREKSVGGPLGVPLLYSIILRRNGRSMLAYLPGDAFWAIQAQLKAGTLKHLEAHYLKPSRGSSELTSLYFY